MKEKIDFIKNHSFFKYSWVGAVFTVLNIGLVWLFIDVLHIPTIISSAVVVGGLFVLKYFFYKWAGLVGRK